MCPLPPLGSAPVVIPDLFTADTWDKFVQNRNSYVRPTIISAKNHAELSPSDRAVYDLYRRIAAANLPVRETPSTVRVQEEMTSVLTTNTLNAAPGVRPGIYLSANGARGKSTLMREVAANYHEFLRDLAEIEPDLAGRRDRWIPVAVISIPAKASIRLVCQRILTFYGEVFSKAESEGSLLGRVIACMSACGTRLLLLDDITRLKMWREADQNVADFIRDLQEFNGTIIGVGVDIPNSGLLTEGPAAGNANLKTQTKRRFNLMQIEDFTYDSDESIRAWEAFLTSIEQTLPLIGHKAGTLARAGDYIYARTQGVVGSTAQLIARAADQAIQRPYADGKETVDVDRLDTITIDFDAENPDAADSATPHPENLRPGVGAGRPGHGKGNGVFARDAKRAPAAKQPGGRATRNQRPAKAAS